MYLVSQMQWVLIGRRKFRSQASNSMDRWKAEMGRVREEKRRRKKIKKRREEKKKENPGARKGRKVAKHCVFPMICGSGGSKSRLAKAAGAEPAGQMRDEKVHAVVARSRFQRQKCQNLTGSEHFWKLKCRKVHAVVARSRFQSQMCQKLTGSAHFWELRCRKVHAVVVRSTFRSQNVQSTSASEHFWKLICRKSARRCGAKHISKSKSTMSTKHHMYVRLLDVEAWFCVAGARDCAPCQKWAKREGLVAFPKTIASVRHLKRICKDAFFVAGAVQETCSSELFGGPGADFLRGVAFWSIRSSGLLRWFCVTGAALRMTWRDFSVAGAALYTDGMEKSQNALVRGCTQLSIFKGSLAGLLSFWCCQLQKLKEVSQNCFVFDVANCENWGSLAELLRFQACR